MAMARERGLPVLSPRPATKISSLWRGRRGREPTPGQPGLALAPDGHGMPGSGREVRRAARAVSRVLAGALLVLAGPAAAHVRLESPPSRYGDEMKAGPCGRLGGLRTTGVTTVRPGQVLTVVFDEIIDHPGYFRIAFDPIGDADLAPPVWNGAAFVNPPSVLVLADHIANPPGLTHGAVPVKLPDIDCDACTLQLIQVMTDKPPFDGLDDFYYQCADLRLSATAPLGGPPPTSAPASSLQPGGCASVAGEPSLAALLAGLIALRMRRSLLVGQDSIAAVRPTKCPIAEAHSGPDDGHVVGATDLEHEGIDQRAAAARTFFRPRLRPEGGRAAAATPRGGRSGGGARRRGAGQRRGPSSGGSTARGSSASLLESG